MIPILKIIIAIAASYLIGSIPSAYIFGRILKNIDIRQFGSGNVGATNAFRVLGLGPGIFVLILDSLKGILAILLISNIFQQTLISQELYFILLGLVAVCGHIWTIFLKGKGGKGMATSLGALIGLAIKIKGLWLIFIIVICVWILVFLISRFVSLASIVSVVILPIFLIIFKESKELILMAFFLCVLVIFRHKSNINRLLHKKEPRINLPFLK
ncbi:MAG: glycerol-3-phosphate 1-O-acyltransferase PlsY [Candidatus Omnitrophota bacterium]